MDFLISLFEALGLYSVPNGLSEHLRGFNHDCSTTGDPYSEQSIYNIVFICLFAINLLIAANYYYGIFNRNPFNRLGWWFLNGLIGAVITGIIAFVYPYNDFSTGNYCKDLSITASDCSGFGLTAAIYSLLLFFIFSVLIKWGSGINKKVPF